MPKRNLIRILLIWVCILIVTALLGKTTIAAEGGKTAADFLNIGIGARAAALGGAYTSAADDATAAYWNPAGLVQVKNAQLAFSHFALYQDISYEYLSMAYPLSERITLGAATSYMNYGTIEGYDQYDNPTGEIGGTYDMAAGLSFGYSFTDKISAGLTAKYVILSLADRSASALAADIGFRYSTPLFAVGMTAANLGQKIKFDEVKEDLPASMRAGVSVWPLGPSFMAALEAEKQFDGNISVKNGFEYNYEHRYFVRTGYSYYPDEDSDRKFGQSFSFGVGALLGPARFDYTFSPEEKFSSESLHRFSVIFDF